VVNDVISYHKYRSSSLALVVRTPTTGLDYTVTQKKGTDFLLCASFLMLDRNW